MWSPPLLADTSPAAHSCHSCRGHATYRVLTYLLSHCLRKGLQIHGTRDRRKIIGTRIVYYKEEKSEGDKFLHILERLLYKKNDDSWFLVFCKDRSGENQLSLHQGSRAEFLALELKHRVTAKVTLTYWWLHAWYKLYSSSTPKFHHQSSQLTGAIGHRSVIPCGHW